MDAITAADWGNGAFDIYFQSPIADFSILESLPKNGDRKLDMSHWGSVFLGGGVLRLFPIIKKLFPG